MKAFDNLKLGLTKAECEAIFAMIDKYEKIFYITENSINF